MSYYLGFDGGGTKTDCALLDGSGHLLAQATAGPSNPRRIGFEQAFASLTAAGDKALTAARIDARQISGVCAGLAGAGRPRVVKRVMAHLVETFPRADVHVTTDVEIALEAAVGNGPGIVLVAGTGSIAFGRTASGRTARAGGLGPAVGDDGSAYDIGRRAIAAVARAREGRGPITLLTELIPEDLECPDWDALLERIAQKPDEVFPRIFPAVVLAAEVGDDVSREILFGGAVALSQLALSVARQVRVVKKEFLLAKSGGVFGHGHLLDATVDALIVSAAPSARIEPLRVSPGVGAARMAIRLMAPTPRSRVAHGVRA